MCTKHQINGFISGTSKRVKFVENVLCSQKSNHILCGNILIICSCVFLVLYLTDLLQLYIPSVFRLICSLTHFNQTHEIPGAVQFLILALSSGIVCHFFVCHAWTVERQTTVNSPTHFHLFPAVFRSLFINVCVDKCDMESF